ncbi:MAG: DDE transposase, partial [Nitrospiraceae bacterium]
EETLAQVKGPRAGPGRPRTTPHRVIADKGYDSDPRRTRLAGRGLERIAPHRTGRTRPPPQEGRARRRYRRRWIIARTFAWLQHFRRRLVRSDRWLVSDQGFFHVACLGMTVRYF